MISTSKTDIILTSFISEQCDVEIPDVILTSVYQTYNDLETSDMKSTSKK